MSIESEPLSAHTRRVVDYYDAETQRYLSGWNAHHFHFGIFRPGEVGPEHSHPSDVPALAEALRRMVDRVVAPAALQPGQRVVDAGCGVGGTAFMLAARHRVDVTGVNVCAHQLEIAQRRATQARTSVRFVWGDCSESLPFATASVDCVVNVESACHYADRPAFVAECARILRPGGVLVAMDWVSVDGLPEARHREAIAPVCDAWHLLSIESPASYARLVREAGLELVEEASFGDEVLPNAVLFSRGARQLAAQPALPPPLRRLQRQFDVLSRAWLDGHFGLYRYAARKPGAADRSPCGSRTRSR